MKTMEELYNEVMASDELKKEFLSLKPEEVEGFASKHGCKASLDEIKTFLTEKSAVSSHGEPGELSDAEIEQAAGGKSCSRKEAVSSALSLGIACACRAIESAIGGNCGTAIEGEGMLCDS